MKVSELFEAVVPANRAAVKADKKTFISLVKKYATTQQREHDSYMRRGSGGKNDWYNIRDTFAKTMKEIDAEFKKLFIKRARGAADFSLSRFDLDDPLELWKNFGGDDLSESIQPLSEGTWAIPSTLKTARALIALLEKPLTIKDATKKLYNLLGDDELFDDLDELKDLCKKDGQPLEDTDVRDTVKKHLKRLIKAGGWKNADERAIDELKKFLAKK